MAREDVPKGLTRDLGVMKVSKGKHKGMQLWSWDAVPECYVDVCKISDTCRYEKGGRCTVQLLYVKSVNELIFRNFEGLDEPTLYRIGMHLVPLYRHLCKLKIEELAVTNALYTTDKGIKKISPIYKEIRETIRQIEMQWKALDLKPKGKGKGGMFPKNTNLFEEDPEDPNFGGNYYDDLEEGIKDEEEGGEESE